MTYMRNRLRLNSGATPLVSTWIKNNAFVSGLTVDYLIVAGGGNGGINQGGGGGAGGYIYKTSQSLSSGSYPVVVGLGAPGYQWVGPPKPSKNGDNSSFNGNTALGGGYGGLWAWAACGSTQDSPSDGGSGGGSVACTPGNGSGTQGHNGGQGVGGAVAGGGGGGAGAVGGNYSGSTGGAGGAGVTNSISGASVLYCGGGGGAGSGAFGAGGGTNNNGGNPPANATGYGDGGGGSGTANYFGQGGPGVVIIRYLSASGSATGGTITTSGAYKIHTFTSNGTFTI